MLSAAIGVTVPEQPQLGHLATLVPLGPAAPFQLSPGPSVPAWDKLQEFPSLTLPQLCPCLDKDPNHLDPDLQTDFPASLQTCLITTDILVICSWFLINLTRPDPDPNVWTDFLAWHLNCLSIMNLPDALCSGLPPAAHPSLPCSLTGAVEQTLAGEDLPCHSREPLWLLTPSPPGIHQP